MKKVMLKLMSAVMAVAIIAPMGVFAAVPEELTTPQTTSKIVYHESFDGSYDTTDFEVISAGAFQPVYVKGKDGTPALSIKSPSAQATAETQSAWIRFLHNAAGDRKLTLDNYFSKTGITEISVDVRIPEPRNLSLNLCTTDWVWNKSIDISENGWAWLSDWESMNNGREIDASWNATPASGDIQKLTKAWVDDNSWFNSYATDFTADNQWHTWKFMYDASTRQMSAYWDDNLIATRFVATTLKPFGLMTIEDQTAVEADTEIFAIDNFTITQKESVNINYNYVEDFSTTTAFDKTKHWTSWWAGNNTPAETPVIDSGDETHGNVLQMNIISTGPKATTSDSDETKIRFLAYDDTLANTYKNNDITVAEVEFKTSRGRKTAVGITPDWTYYYSVVLSKEGWASLVGNQGNPSVASNAKTWLGYTKKQFLQDSSRASLGICGYEVNANTPNWHKVQFVFDKPNSTMSAYLDGIYLGTRELSSSVIPKMIYLSDSTGNIAVGAEVMQIDNIKIGTIAKQTSANMAVADSTGAEKAKIADGDTVYAKLSNAINLSPTEDKPVRLLFASYDANMVMTGVKTRNYVLSALSATTVDGEALRGFDLNLPEGTKEVKIFMWDGENHITPVCAQKIVGK